MLQNTADYRWKHRSGLQPFPLVGIQAGETMFVTNSKRLTLAGARKMMETATTHAERAGYAVAVSIVDAGGHPVLIQRMDGGRFHT
ncbi:MAG: GlcG/HbpS family heme-binding protein, partial [Burkholderiales bacterium]